MGTAITHGSEQDRNVIAQVEYDKAGRMTALRDPRGKLTTYDYDGLDRRTLLTNPLNQQWGTAYERLSDGRTRTTQTDPLTYQTAQETDRAGRLATIQYLGESSPKPTPDVAFAYDKLGTRLRMSELDGETTVRETSYDYDAMRRLNTVAFDRDGNGSADETVTYAYDARGRRTKLTMPGDLEISYSYDEKGRLISLTDWDSQSAQYDYDAVDRLRLTTEANGMTRGYNYDAANRLTEIHHSRYGKTLGFFGYSVDGRGNRTQAYERIPHASTGSDLTVSYDNSAIIYSGTWAESSPTGFMETSTTNDNLVVIFYGDEAEVTLQKNPAGGDFEIWVDGSLKLSDNAYSATEQTEVYPLTGLGAWTHGLVLVNTGSSTTLQFQQVELLGDVILYEDQTIQYSYDELSRVKQAKYYAGANTGATPRRQYDYAFDVAGNRTQQSLTLNGGSPTVDNYSYDAANRISNGGFSYDAAGRMTSDGTNTYTWDRANRLLSMGGVDYQYNGLGQRIEQTVSSVVTKYLLDQQPGLFQVLAATTGSDTERFVHGPHGVGKQKDKLGNWEYLNADGLDTVRTVTDGIAGVLESRLYTPIGKVIDTTGTSQTPFGFTGEPTDPITELLYLRARYYNPALGVFPSLDPWEGDTAVNITMNRYIYGGANPVNNIDPTGAWFWSFTTNQKKTTFYDVEQYIRRNKSDGSCRNVFTANWVAYWLEQNNGGIFAVHNEFPGGGPISKIDTLITTSPLIQGKPPQHQGGAAGYIYEIEPAFKRTYVAHGYGEMKTKLGLLRSGMPPFLHRGILPAQDFWPTPTGATRAVTPLESAPYDWTGMTWQEGFELSPAHARGPVRVAPNDWGASGIPDAYWIILPVDGLVLYASECEIIDELLKEGIKVLTGELVRRILLDRYRKARESYSGKPGYGDIPAPQMAYSEAEVPISANSVLDALLILTGTCLILSIPGPLDDILIGPALGEAIRRLSWQPG